MCIISIVKTKIKILYEDDNIVVIDKPFGISVHKDGKKDDWCISDWFVENFPESKNVGEAQFINGKEVFRSGVVHRLDRDTSGVLLLVKNQEAYYFFKKKFKDRKIKKIYLAVVNGWMKNEKGIIDKPIGRSPSDFRRRLSGRGARGELREAVTEYKVLKKFEEAGEKFSVLEVSPKTGRTHQIRVHLKYLNFPIVSDSLYNPGKPCPKEITHLALCAKSLEFENIDGKNLKIETKTPKEFNL